MTSPYWPILVVFILASLSLIPFFAHLVLLSLASFVRFRSSVVGGPSTVDTTRFRVILPAHDEEESIGQAVASCRAIEYDPTRFEVVVIADNCQDRTAEVAWEAGAEVFVRSAPDRRGKGPALADFLSGPGVHANTRGFDAVIIVDADSVVDPGILRAFDRSIVEGWDWLQGYSTSSNPDATGWTRLTTYALGLINGVQLLGSERLGLGAAFRGNGMCFTRKGLERFPWTASGLAEDLEFTWMLRVAGERVHFVPEAVVRSEMVEEQGAAAAAQRRRWGFGRKEVRRRFLSPLLQARAIGPIRKALMLVDLCAPPLVTLLIALLGLAGIHVLGLFDAEIEPSVRFLRPIHALMALALIFYLISPVITMGIPARYLVSVLATSPRYVVWRLFSKGNHPEQWVRTARGPLVMARKTRVRTYPLVAKG